MSPERADRWEHGSDFHQADLAEVVAAEPRWVPDGASFYHSGRDALSALLRVGAARGDYRRVLFPSFYCPDVLAAARAAGLSSVFYAHAPGQARLDSSTLSCRAGDVVVVANVYGSLSASPLTGDLPDGVTVVEDHTHDPASEWASSSSAHYAFSSLRKWFPLPDGGVLWSPRGRQVPLAPRLGLAHATITLDRLGAMVLKARFLAGHDIAKETYRSLALRGEEHIGAGEPSGMSEVSRALLDQMPAQSWRATRRANHDSFVGALRGVAGVDIVTVGAPVPFAVTLCLPTREARDRLKGRLVAERIYPAVLWSLDADAAPGMPEEHVDLSRRILSLHCDHRYDGTDMSRVAAVVRNALVEVR